MHRKRTGEHLLLPNTENSVTKRKDLDVSDHIAKLFALSAEAHLSAVCDFFPDVIFKHQIYSFNENRTAVDQKLDTLLSDSELRLIRLDIHNAGECLVRVGDFESYVKSLAGRPSRNFDIIGAFLNGLRQFPKGLNFENSQLRQSFLLSEADITMTRVTSFPANRLPIAYERILVRLGVLLPNAELDSFSLSIPGASLITKSYHLGRRNTLSMLRRRKYKELLQNELLKKKLPKRIRFPIEFFLHDLVGADLIQSTSGSDDLASTDEVTVYKAEGEEQEDQRGSENLSEDKFDLVKDEEERASQSHILSGLSDRFDFLRNLPGRLGIPPFPYTPVMGGYPYQNGTSLPPGLPPSLDPLSLMYAAAARERAAAMGGVLPSPSSPPPAHAGLPFSPLDTKSGLLNGRSPSSRYGAAAAAAALSAGKIPGAPTGPPHPASLYGHSAAMAELAAVMSKWPPGSASAAAAAAAAATSLPSNHPAFPSAAGPSPFTPPTPPSLPSPYASPHHQNLLALAERYRNIFSIPPSPTAGPGGATAGSLLSPRSALGPPGFGYPSLGGAHHGSLPPSPQTLLDTHRLSLSMSALSTHDPAGAAALAAMSVAEHGHFHHRGAPSPDSKKNHVKKPLNAFMLFMKENRAQVIKECTLKESAAINQILGRKWHSLSKEEQSKYYEMARKEKELHLQMYPGWSARDNYALHSKRKKRRREMRGSGADSKDCSNAKKCRARFGIEQHDMWCQHCKRKKRCLRFTGPDDEADDDEADSLENPLSEPPSLSCPGGDGGACSPPHSSSNVSSSTSGGGLGGSGQAASPGASSFRSSGGRQHPLSTQSAPSMCFPSPVECDSTGEAHTVTGTTTNTSSNNSSAVDVEHHSHRSWHNDPDRTIKEENEDVDDDAIPAGDRLSPCVVSSPPLLSPPVTSVLSPPPALPPPASRGSHHHHLHYPHHHSLPTSSSVHYPTADSQQVSQSIGTAAAVGGSSSSNTRVGLPQNPTARPKHELGASYRIEAFLHSPTSSEDQRSAAGRAGLLTAGSYSHTKSPFWDNRNIAKYLQHSARAREEEMAAAASAVTVASAVSGSATRPEEELCAATSSSTSASSDPSPVSTTSSCSSSSTNLINKQQHHQQQQQTQQTPISSTASGAPATACTADLDSGGGPMSNHSLHSSSSGLGGCGGPLSNRSAVLPLDSPAALSDVPSLPSPEMHAGGPASVMSVDSGVGGLMASPGRSALISTTVTAAGSVSSSASASASCVSKQQTSSSSQRVFRAPELGVQQ